MLITAEKLFKKLLEEEKILEINGQIKFFLGQVNIIVKQRDVVRNAWEAIFILLRYMCQEKEEKTCPSWMLAVHGSLENHIMNGLKRNKENES